jgi:hypothetical protein
VKLVAQRDLLTLPVAVQDRAAVTGGNPCPAAVGTAGTIVSGTAPDGSQAVTVLLFTPGNAVTNLEFDCPPNDPVPPQFVTDVGQNKTPRSSTDYPPNHDGPMPRR